LSKKIATKKLEKGLLLVIEGIDGAGKSTQVKMIVEKLKSKGYPVVSLHEPTDGVFGQQIRKMAIHGRKNVTVEEEFKLFVEDRVENVKFNIKPALEANKIVVMDRYYFSNIAYQGARGLNLEYIEKCNIEFAPEPDLLIILDIKPSVSLQRIRQNREEGTNAFEKIKLLKQSREIFKSFSDRKYVKIIENNDKRSPAAVFEDIWSIVETKLLTPKSEH